MGFLQDGHFENFCFLRSKQQGSQSDICPHGTSTKSPLRGYEQIMQRALLLTFSWGKILSSESLFFSNKYFEIFTKLLMIARVVYDRVRKRKNYFKIPAFLQIERGKSRAGKFKTSNENKKKRFCFNLILNLLLLIFHVQSEERREF